MTNEKIIRVGIGVIILNDKSQFLMGKRRNAHGEGSWGLPGGHLEFGETIENCAIRETLEETGLHLQDVEIIATRTHFFDDGAKHYVTIFCIGHAEGEPQLCEPHKTESWQFFDDWNNLPQPEFVPYSKDVSVKDIKNYFKLLQNERFIK